MKSHPILSRRQPRPAWFWPAALVTLLLAACGSAASAPASSAAPPAASPAASAPASSAAPAAAGGAPTGNPSSPVTLHESGSTLILPFLQKLVGQVHGDYPNITLAPSGGGSGKGISDAISHTVQMGGSDAYLSDQQAKANPSLLNIPIAISAQAINYNLPGIKDLKITGDVLAKIYENHITSWDDPAIKALNPGVKLPKQRIIPVRRVDASGDTFIFTSLLNATNPAWKRGPAFGTTVTWPALSGELTANGNPAMIQVCKANPGCVAYIGVSVEQTAIQQGLGEALLQNRSGKFLHPTKATITAAVDAGAGSTPADLRAPLIYLAGDSSYPIVNYEYLMIQKKQSSVDTALALRTFLTWAIDPSKGSAPANLSSVDFVALPSVVLPKVTAAIDQIGA